MSINKVVDFSKDSFVFEDAVENKFESRKINLTELDQGPLLLKVEDCLSYVVNKNDKFGKTTYSMSIALGGKEQFVSVLELVEKVCSNRVHTDGENIMKCLYRKGNNATLYVKIDCETEIYPIP